MVAGLKGKKNPWPSSSYSFLLFLGIRKIEVSCINGRSVREFNTEIQFLKKVKSAAWGNFGNLSKTIVSLPPPDFVSIHKHQEENPSIY